MNFYLDSMNIAVLIKNVHVEVRTPDETEDVAELGPCADVDALPEDTELGPCETPAVCKYICHDKHTPIISKVNISGSIAICRSI